MNAQGQVNGPEITGSGQDGSGRNGAQATKRIGILVIHGIGQANPYETLDSFARGLYRHFHTRSADGSESPVYAMQTEWKQRTSDPSHKQQSWTQAQILFTKRGEDPLPAAFPNAPKELTMAEYYWSPATKGKLKDLDVLTWLIRTGLEPFRYLSENLQAMEAPIEESGQPRISRSANPAYRRAGHSGRTAFLGFILGRELLRLGCLYLPLLASFAALVAFLQQLPNLPAILAPVAADVTSKLAGLGVALRLMVLGSLAGYFAGFYKWLRFRVPRTGLQQRYDFRALAGAALIAAAVFAAPRLFVPRFFSQPPTEAAPVIVAALGWAPAWLQRLLAWAASLLLVKGSFMRMFLPLAELSIAAVIRGFLINFVGDVAIYTNLNQRSANFSIRAQILEECGHAVTSLYQDLQASGDDFSLVIAAHSLGTVIAFDTINDLFNRARIGAAAASGGSAAAPGGSMMTAPQAIEICRHLRGMLTFGSPLNKTYYFFRDQSPAQDLIRAQLIDQIHSFRLVPPFQPMRGAPVEAPRMIPGVQALIAQFGWFNVWATMDPISGKLYFYDVPGPCQYHRWYWKPILAHLSYWRDEKMYAYFAENLLSS
jgi:hypothetical protein